MQTDNETPLQDVPKITCQRKYPILRQQRRWKVFKIRYTTHNLENDNFFFFLPSRSYERCRKWMIHKTHQKIMKNVFKQGKAVRDIRRERYDKKKIKDETKVRKTHTTTNFHPSVLRSLCLPFPKYRSEGTY